MPTPDSQHNRATRQRAPVHSAGLSARSFAARLVEFAEELRGESLAIGTAELLDAINALDRVPWDSRDAVRTALASTLAKSRADRDLFDAVFDRFFFRASEIAAVQEGVLEHGGIGGDGDQADGSGRPGHADDLGDERFDPEALRRAIAQAIAAGDESMMGDLARMAISTFGQDGPGSGVLGVDVQRIRRQLALSAEPQPDRDPDDPRAGGLPREQLRRFEQILRRELERDQIERTGELPPARPLNELARALPSGPLADLAAIHRVTQQLKRKLKTQGMEHRGRRRRNHVDMRRTMRASLEFGGVPVVIKERPIRPKRPELYVLCDVSTSVTTASVFFLSVLHALHDAFRKMRSFVFIERVAEVTAVFERERDFAAATQAISQTSGVADVSGYTDYGRVWTEFLRLVVDDLDPRSTVIVLGDARSNGRPPQADLFATIAAKAGRTFWLNPEPRLYWNYGDSVISQYESSCEAYECWTVPQLEQFVGTLISGR